MDVEIYSDYSPDYQSSLYDTALNPVGNEIFWAFKTATIGTNGTASLTITLTALNLVVGDSITINGRTYPVKASPGPYELAAGGALLNGQRLISYLNTDPVISPYYVVYVVGLDIVLQAIKPGTAFNITYSANLTNAGAITVVNGAGNDLYYGQSLENFALRFRLYVDTSAASKVRLGGVTTTTAANSLRTNPVFQAEWTQDNRLAVHIEQTLRGYCYTPTPNYNPLVPTPILPASQMLVRYWFEYEESYIPAGEVSPITNQLGTFGADTIMLYAVNSALPKFIDPVFIDNQFRVFWRRDVGANQYVHFLTGMYANKETHIDSYELLYFIYTNLGKARSSLGLIYNFYFEDGTELLDQHTPIISTSFGSNSGTANHVEVGYRQILANFPMVEATSRIARFEVAVYERFIGFPTDFRWTVFQSYKLNNETRCDAFKFPQLVFLNLLGGMDTFRFTGFYTKTVSVENKTYEHRRAWKTAGSNLPLFQQLPIDESAIFVDQDPSIPPTQYSPEHLSETSNYQNVNAIEYLLESGLISKEQWQWLSESLFVTNDCYMISFTEANNVGNPNMRIMREVYMDGNSFAMEDFADTQKFTIKVLAGLPNAQLLT